MDRLNIDIETYSSVDIKSAGSYKYVESNDFEILLFAYSLNGSKVEVVDLLQGEKIPAEIVERLADGKTELRAYNAAFEYTALKRAGYETNLNQWKCTMVQGLYASYPAGLDRIAKALKLDDEHLKDTKGKALIKQFSTNDGTRKLKRRNFPSDDFEGWKAYIEYNRQDVVTEMAVLKAIESFDLPDFEWNLWRLDVKMNLRGIQLDDEFFNKVIEIDDLSKKDMEEKFKELTNGVNATSSKQLLEFLKSKGCKIDSTKKEMLDEILENTEDLELKTIISLALELKKSSLAKYRAMKEVAGKDGRARGILQFYGGNRTGRYAGRLIQAQNLPRNVGGVEELQDLKDLIKNNGYETLKDFFGSDFSKVLSSLIRTSFITPENKKFIVSDFASIESRVLSWLSNENWRMEVFATHGKIYEQTASILYGVPFESVLKGGENYHLRQQGKIAELACGYGMGGPGLANRYKNLTTEEAEDIVSKWRKANPSVVNFWQECDRAFKDLINNKISYTYVAHGKIKMAKNNKNIEVTLPSGRKLFYLNVHMRRKSGVDWEESAYWIGDLKGFSEVGTYGGKLVENFTQAVARDFLANALVNLEKAGYKTVMHIHDEVVIEATLDETLENVNEILQKAPAWGKGITLKAAGFENSFYMKD